MSLMNYGFTKSGTDTSGKKKTPDSKRNSDLSDKSSDTKSPVRTPQKQSEVENKLTPVKGSSKSPSKSNSPMKSPSCDTKTNSNTQSQQAANEVLHYSPFSQRTASELSLPPQRIKMIMKSCPEVEMVPQESLHVVTKATELFIQHLAKESLGSVENKAKLDYECLSNHIHSCPNLEFLKETVPKKLTLEECKKIIEIKNRSRVAESI